MRHLTIAATALALSAGAASAATILDTTADAVGSLTMGSFGPPSQTEPIGQTFKLTSATENLMAGGVFRDVNEFSNPNFEVTISIYGGDTFSSPILGSQTFTFADGFDGLQTADFSSLGTLAAGTYALGFSSPGTRGAVRFSRTDFGSTDTLDANGLFTTASDLAVLVTGDSASLAPVPLPAGFPLLAAGLIGLGVFARRKKLLNPKPKRANRRCLGCSASLSR